MPKKKTTRKKTTRTASRSTATKRKTATKVEFKTKAGTVEKPRTKSQIFADISEDTGLTRKEVQSVFDSMQALLKKDIGRRGPGSFTVPGLMKVVKRHVARKPARKNVWVPLVQEFRDIPAKPARNVVKVRPLKNLKDMV